MQCDWMNQLAKVTETDPLNEVVVNQELHEVAQLECCPPSQVIWVVSNNV